ncbi:hypothetical protein KP509_21G032700 [Ceratopteris richardii]|uniref:Leucine-rich repeat-containing N-terminal plant-type domain-containing protein n=1 Tax=Ceratopteris richardii TaxID=49495 RepID=A0A8T2SBM4_CERRI|nr:hypothetical protein KP509_1Z303700 [Ceratopteris richardii]KAH7315074.1 hypothetical protein KP509_21G032700 [Ceratopteris richardii]KAH7315076.1 hypothetical protein KP509_21G032700 [Ceratopteris richardii]
MNPSLFFILILGPWCFGNFASATESESLLKVMEAWKANFSSWVGDNPCSGWERVTCDSLGRVIELNLSNAGIVGPVPANLVDLKYLTLLDLSNPRYNPGPLWNAVSGDLAGLEGLTNLQYLDVSFNNITLDSFPSAVFKLTNLVTMRIDNLRIGGPLPKELLNLTKLEKM